MSEIHGATGSYVLNALDPSELDEFEAHLDVCPTCSREVLEFCETAAELSLLSQATPPPALKGSIIAAIGGVRVLPPLPDPEAPAEPAESRTELVAVADPDPEPAARPAPVDELALRRQRRMTRVLSLAVAAAMVVALALGGWVVDLVQQRDAQIASIAAETELISAPDAKTYPFRLKDGTNVSFVASKVLNRAMFTSGSLPDPGADRAWQLWTLAGDLDDPQIRPDRTLAGGTTVRQFLQGDIAGSSALAISIEREGGADQPTPTTIQDVIPL